MFDPDPTYTFFSAEMSALKAKKTCHLINPSSFIHSDIEQARIIYKLSHTVRHVLQSGVWACLIFKSNTVTNSLAQRNVHFFGNTLCYRHSGDSSGLRASNIFVTADSSLEQELWHLCSLSRTGFSLQDHHLVFIYEIENLLAGLPRGQLLSLLQDGIELVRKGLSCPRVSLRTHPSFRSFSFVFFSSYTFRSFLFFFILLFFF